MTDHNDDHKEKKSKATKIGEVIMAIAGGLVGLVITITSILSGHTGGAVAGIVTVACCIYLFRESKKDTW